MKILMLSPQPFFTPRGTPISVYQRLEACSALNYEVDLLTYHVGTDVSMPGLTIHRCWGPARIDHVPIGPSLIKIFLDFILCMKACWMLARGRYDILHTHEEAAFMGLALAPIFRIPHLYDMHSRLSQQLAHSRFGRFTPAVKLFAWLERLAVKRSAGVITIGSDLAEYVGSIRCNTPYCTIENMAIRSSEVISPDLVSELETRYGIGDQLRIVYTGTFEPYQGLELLFESARIVCKRRPDSLFIMVGGRPEQIAYWQGQMKAAGIDHHFKFTGILPLAEAISFLEVADILVSPRTKGLSIPLKIYSYLHSGTVIVATDIEAHTQLLDESIAVITPTQPAAFGAAIVEIANDEVRRKEIGRQAAEFARVHFDATTYQERVKLIMEAVLNPRFQSAELDRSILIE